MISLKVDSLFTRITRPGWERCTVVLARGCTRHVKNARAVYFTHLKYGMHSYIFTIFSVYTIKNKFIIVIETLSGGKKC